VTQELFTFSKLLPAPKKINLNHWKRGLINVEGDALKFLFGVATTQQLQELHNTVEGIKARDSDVIHAIQKQLTYLKSVDEAVSQNAVGLPTVARILKNVITNAFTYQTTLNTATQHLEDLVFFQSNFHALCANWNL
jgi:hypothetical protein